jgi:hypothetical protein
LILSDLALLAWVGGWIYVAVAVGIDVRSLGQLTRTLHSAGAAVTATGHAAASLGNIPFVGHAIGKLGERVLRTGHSTEATARYTGRSVRHLSLLLPIVIALVPIVPVLLVYLPLRVQRRREAWAVAKLLRQGDDLEARRLLAHRAVSNLSFHRLESLTDDPWQDLDDERYDVLAAAELRRLGVILPLRREAA